MMAITLDSPSPQNAFYNVYNAVAKNTSTLLSHSEYSFDGHFLQLLNYARKLDDNTLPALPL